MRVHIGRQAALATVLVSLALPAGAGSQLTMRVSPGVAYAPASFTIHVFVEPHAENRAIHVFADSALFFRSSVVELDGQRAPRTTIIRYRAMPAGAYEVSTVLLGEGGEQRAIVRQGVTVIGGGGQ